MQWGVGDLYGAQENLTAALHSLDSSDTLHFKELGYAYKILGNTSLDLKLYEEAIHFYDKALNFAKGTDFYFDLLNAKAIALQKNKQYSAALQIYDSVLQLKVSDQALVARLIDNRATTRWLQNSAYPALPEWRQALKIRMDSQYYPGMVTSYQHFADYYAGSKKDSAAWYATQMYATAKKTGSNIDILDALKKLVSNSKEADKKESWFREFNLLNDSLQLARDSTRNRFAFIRYDFQKSRADNLLLQEHITLQRLLMGALAVLAAITVFMLAARYRKRRKKIQLAAEQAIQMSKLKTSQKVHDVVANGLYRIMNELEHTNAIEKEPLINSIEGLYERSRNISYEDDSTVNDVAYNRQVHNLLNSFSNKDITVIIVGNQQSFWDKISALQKQELQMVLGELMVNMKKHSRAKNVSLVFKQEQNNASIIYKDDGIGLSTEQLPGNGLKNTVNRIKSLGGTVTFEQNEPAGLSIVIGIPLQPSNA